MWTISRHCIDKMWKTYSWGNNEEGQLGLGHNTNQILHKKLNLPNVIAISCGGYHTVILLNNGIFIVVD